MQAAAEELRPTRLRAVRRVRAPTPATAARRARPGMMDSLPYRNDAAMVLRRLIRSLPTRQGRARRGHLRQGPAGDDDGPGRRMRDLPCVLVPGGVTLPPTRRRGRRARSRRSAPASPTARSRWRRPPSWAAAPARRPAAAASSSAPRRRRRSSARRSGLSLPHSALAPSGQPIWLDMARRSARAAGRPRRAAASTTARHPHRRRGPQRDGRPRRLRRLDEPAAAHPGHRPRRRAAAARRVEDWIAVNRRVPRLVDALPNGPSDHPTVRVFLAGGVPEVMLHLRALGPARRRLPDRDRRAARRTCSTGGRRSRAARGACASACCERDGVDPDDVIMSPDRGARARADQHRHLPARQPGAGGLGHQEHGHRPERGRRRRRLPQDRPGAGLHHARRAAIAAIKGQGRGAIKPGDVLVLICRGPMGAGMEEIYQITVGPEAPALRQARRRADRRALLRRLDRRLHRPRRPGGAGRRARSARCATATDPDRHRPQPAAKARVDLVGATASECFGAEEGARVLAARPPRPDLAPDPDLPDDTRLWAALQHVGGGTWGGCVYDVDAITTPSRPADKMSEDRYGLFVSTASDAALGAYVEGVYLESIRPGTALSPSMPSSPTRPRCSGARSWPEPSAAPSTGGMWRSTPSACSRRSASASPTRTASVAYAAAAMGRPWSAGSPSFGAPMPRADCSRAARCPWSRRRSVPRARRLRRSHSPAGARRRPLHPHRRQSRPARPLREHAPRRVLAVGPSRRGGRAARAATRSLPHRAPAGRRLGASAVGETRVDLLHLLEDLRDAYVGPAEETILTEIVANALDSGATRIAIAADPTQRTFTLVDNGGGMRRRELARYHDIAASTKTRGEGIGFAGVGIKMALLVSREVLTETRQRGKHVATTWALASRHRAPWKWVRRRARGRARDGGAPHRGQCSLTAPGPWLFEARRCGATSTRCSIPWRFMKSFRDHYPSGVGLHHGHGAGSTPRGASPRRRPRSASSSHGDQAVRRRAYMIRDRTPLPEERRATRHRHARQGDQARLGLARHHAADPSVGGLIEVPALAENATGHSTRSISSVRGRRRNLSGYRKAIQEAVARRASRVGRCRRER